MLPNKTTMQSIEYSLPVVGQRHLGDLQNNPTTVIILGFSSETDKTLLLLASKSLITGHGETKLVLTRKIPSSG